jgi:hypothetical protein
VARPRADGRRRGETVIRQAITCDICASEKKQTNHWFVAYEQGGELRVSGWSSRNRLRPGSKHLCGQTCLHKLVDDFMARTIVRAPAAAEPNEPEHPTISAVHAVPATPAPVPATDTSLTMQSNTYAGLDDFESSARLITPHDPALAAPVVPPAALAPRSPAYRASAELVRMPGRGAVEDRARVQEETPRYSSRNWRSEAWEREREREMRAAARLRSNG